jgi:hypothetical protein
LGESVSEVIQAAFGLAYVSASKAVGLTDWIVRYREDFRRGSVALKRSISLSASAGAPDSEAYHVLS